jgi:lipopolysaccharide export system permease protein
MTLTLHRMLLGAFFPVLLIALAFFVSILQLVDLFENVARYIDLEVPIGDVLTVQWLYLPKTLHFALPMSLLFAISFTLGTFYSNNELIAVLGSGVSLRVFIFPIVALGLLLSAASFFFEEYVVIDMLREKNALERELLNISRSSSNSNVTRLGSASRVLYHADYYNDASQSLSGVTVLERDEDGRPLQYVIARTATWNGSSWDLRAARVFTYGDELVESFEQVLTVPRYVLPPSAFARQGREIDEMRLEEARAWIESQQTAGLPYREDLTKYHERFAFSLTPFIVVLVAAAVGSRFKKNILLLSLLVSLGVSVIYYVTQMVSGLMAYSGHISPIMGAWSGVVLFLVIGFAMLRMSRT